MFERWRLKRKGKSGQGIVTAAKKRGGERGPDRTRTSVTYDVTVKMRFEDGGEVERSFSVGNPLLGTSLSFGGGDVVPVLFDPDDHSRFVVDERRMINDQKAWLDRKQRESADYDRQQADEAERKLPPTPG